MNKVDFLACNLKLMGAPDNKEVSQPRCNLGFVVLGKKFGSSGIRELPTEGGGREGLSAEGGWSRRGSLPKGGGQGGALSGGDTEAGT